MYPVGRAIGDKPVPQQLPVRAGVKQSGGWRHREQIKIRANALGMSPTITVALHGSLAVLASLTMTFKSCLPNRELQYSRNTEQKDNDYKIGDCISS